MGYTALGALPMCSLLLSSLVCIVLWRRYPLQIVSEMRRYLNALIKDDKSHFENLGYVAVGFLALITFMIRYIFVLMNPS